MKFIQFSAAASALALAACMSDTEATPSVVDDLVGKQLVSENGTVFIFNSDGTVGGSLGGENIVGEYVATPSEVCSTYTAPDRLVGSEFCSVPEISDGTVIFNREDGSQSQLYSIKG